VPNRIKTKKWVIYRHTNDLSLTITLAQLLKSSNKGVLSKRKKFELLMQLREMGLFNERNDDFPLDSINHNINHLVYYMFGYKYEDKFLFSPLGNLYLKRLGQKNKINKIFLTQLWGLQFYHPIIGGTDESFNLYPFRLIFKLLRDERIGNELQTIEVILLLVFVKNVTKETYDELIQNILAIRKLRDKKIIEIIKEDEHVYVNALYEWDYYLCKILESAGLINRDIGNEVCRLQHGTNTTRILRRNKIRLTDELIRYCDILLNNYPYTSIPIDLNDSGRMKIDIIKEIYGFFPKELLVEIGAKEESRKQKILELPRLIDEFSNNEEGKTWSPFEQVLTMGFNMFYNVEARRIGGPGNTDIECLYITLKEKFAVDAKSTKNKLSSLNSGRLRRHRNKIGGQYTIIVTPRYTPIVLDDISESKIVILLASTFAEFLYNCIDNNIKEIDYSIFNDIIINNFSTDISDKVSNITIERFGIKSTLREVA